LDSPDRADAVVLAFVEEQSMPFSGQRPAGW